MTPVSFVGLVMDDAGTPGTFDASIESNVLRGESTRGESALDGQVLIRPE